MPTLPYIFLLILLFISCVNSSWQPNFHLGRPKYDLRPLPIEEDEATATTPARAKRASGFGGTEGYFNQKLDHFSNSTTMWSQRYFSNMKYFSGKAAFLWIGGRGPENIDWVQNEQIPYIQWAKQYGAAIFVLEHRYYGKSQPTVNQSVANLQWLSSKQAVEDIATFIPGMVQKNGLGNVRWILFGGSYSGSIALWARSKHPKLIAGAIGSSAPLQADVDFYQYLQTTSKSLASVGGCTAQIRDGFLTMTQNMLTPEGRDKMDTIFKFNPPLKTLNLTYDDIQYAYMSQVSNFQFAVQMNQVNKGVFAYKYGIQQVCALMNDSTVADPMQRLQNVNAYMADAFGAPFNNTASGYQDTLNYLKIETWDGVDDPGARGWTWQTCSELGYFQSTDGGEVDGRMNNIFGAVLPNYVNVNLCEDLFGMAYGSKELVKAVQDTNNYYGGNRNYPGTNVLIPNHSLDPWATLSKISYLNDDSTVVLITSVGTSHCADIYPQNNLTAQGVLDIWKLANSYIGTWISEPPNYRVLTNITKPWVRPESSIVPPLSSSTIINKASRLAANDVQTPVPRNPILKKFRFGRPSTGFKQDVGGEAINTPPGFESGFFDQLVDHFENRNVDTFSQQYFKNTQWAKPGGPNFIMIGGEGPESSSWVTNPNITYLTWAQQFGATVYLLEHRFYGKSTITPDGTNQNYYYLNSLQMLYDVANFIKYVNFNTNSTAPWITFGGSYSGALSLWMREVFPDVVLGAVGSSGPVFAKLDFFEYLQVTEASIRSYSNPCADAIQDAFNTIHQLSLSAPGRTNLTTTFQLFPPWLPESEIREVDMQFFFSNIFGNYQGAVQYSGDNTRAYADGHGIPDMCTFMLNTNQSNLQNVADFNQYFTIFEQGYFNGTYNDYDGFIQMMINADANPFNADDAAGKFWLWQTCTEFGYFQTTNTGHNIFGGPTPVNLYVDMCQKVFPNQFITMNSIDNQVYQTNWKYGGRDNYRGTNVVAPNGSLDPWHALGTYTSNDPSVVTYLINGTAHCADMYPARASDLPDLVYARNLIQQNIAHWLNQPAVTLSPSTAPPPPSGQTNPPVTLPNGATTAPTQAPVVTTSDARDSSSLLLPILVSALLYIQRV